MYILFSLLISSAFAYIPEYKTILSRTAENHGRGVYQIEQDVVFRSGVDTWVAKETWWIKDENNMRLQVEGRGALKGLLQLQVIYDGNQKHVIDSSGTVKTSRLSEDWAEPVFHFRFSKNIRNKLVSQKVLPPESLRDPNRIIGKPESFYPPSYARLARSGGVVNYAFGHPTPPNESVLKPGLWIEQDQFVVRKIRFPSQLTVTADQYQRFDNGFMFPKARSYTWGTQSAQAQVLDVRALKIPADLFSPSKLSTTWTMKIPDQEPIREFYLRYR